MNGGRRDSDGGTQTNTTTTDHNFWRREDQTATNVLPAQLWLFLPVPYWLRT